MPRLSILTPEQTKAFEKKASDGSRARIKDEFDQLIAPMEVGQFASVELGDDENKVTTRNRLKGAAERRGLSIVFHRTKTNDPIVIFHLEENGNGKENGDGTEVFAKVKAEKE